ncbi:NADH dehydrogenase subunit J [Nitrosospira sp. Nsp14]|jgi:NADH-quinone oxidoreductase subunit J|uniref:NADH-quinone oxidoreductase subunit J n=1 Tax=Nitrosospira sp. Nsp14 TaxID=1855333 RepID=UPI0008E9C5A8|nr:NADH-quinone oxidoreductase subunit J [Nitrosospira sp. Nsp14]SFH27081.1 NADH dehydrogenase subunit J [Nitrosospira sp. Nsp14]
MSFQDIIFYFFSTVLVLAALGVITARNPVHAALLLVLAFFTSSGLWLLLEAEFLAITLVLVYVGAVMVLFLFVVMMLDINIDRLREGFLKWFPFGALLALVMAAEMAMVLMGKQFGLEEMPAPPSRGADYSNTKELGRLIYTEYVYAFELAAVILLVAIVAAIALTLRQRTGTKSVDASKQVAVKRADRIRMVSMPSEKKE